MPVAKRATGSDSAVLRVLVAEDHPLFRQAVCGAIDRHPGLTVVGQAIDGHEALKLINALQPDVAVLDYRMPGLTGAEVCQALRGKDEPPTTALLMLSAYEDGELVWGATSAGAVGYLGKTASPAEICNAIEYVGRGGVAFTEATGQAVSDGFVKHFESAADGAPREVAPPDVSTVIMVMGMR